MGFVVPMRCLLAYLLVCSASAAALTPCISPENAQQHYGKNVCMRAHVYDVHEEDSGTRYLDVCAPQTKDNDCHFYIVSFKSDEPHVGNLEPLRDADIEIRGTVREYHGRAEMVLNDQQQLHGGKPRFTPNPALSKFDASTGHVAFKDPSATQTIQAKGAFTHRGSRAKSTPVAESK
jgi:hypothetical protein